MTVSGGRLLRALHCGNVELELDLLADENATLVERDVEVQAPVAAVDGRLAFEARPEIAPGVVGRAGELEVDRDGIALAVDREVTDEGVDIVVNLRDLRRGELDAGVDLDIEEVRAAQVRVAILVSGVDAVGIDRDADAAVVQVLLVEIDLAAVDLEVAADVDHHRVLGSKADAAVRRVDVVGAGQGGCGGVGGGAHCGLRS